MNIIKYIKKKFLNLKNARGFASKKTKMKSQELHKINNTNA